jgi:hypothetical protein
MYEKMGSRTSSDKALVLDAAQIACTAAWFPSRSERYLPALNARS